METQLMILNYLIASLILLLVWGSVVLLLLMNRKERKEALKLDYKKSEMELEKTKLENETAKENKEVLSLQIQYMETLGKSGEEVMLNPALAALKTMEEIGKGQRKGEK